MSTKKDVTPEEEVKETEEGVETEVEETTEEETPEKTVDELLGGEKDDEDTPESVPLKTFLETKKEKKSLEKEVASLKEQIEKGATKAEIESELSDIASEFDVDPKFLEKLSTTIYSKAKKEAKDALDSKLKPLEAKEKAEKINKLFDEHFDKVMEENPEYAKVVNKDVIKELSLLPANAKKTFLQIIEEAYGQTVPGKKTMETSTPRGGKDVSIDMSRIEDPEYFKEVMANPELKKQYNEGIEGRVNL